MAAPPPATAPTGPTGPTGAFQQQQQQQPPPPTGPTGALQQPPPPPPPPTGPASSTGALQQPALSRVPVGGPNAPPVTGSTGAKRILIFSDGTGEDATTTQAGSQSNVARLASSLSPVDLNNRQQIAFYQQGLGTGSNVLSNLPGLAAGKGIDQNLQIIYQQIAAEYASGDILSFVGFSRGAFTARCAANFVADTGIVPHATAQVVSQLYQAWVTNLKGGVGTSPLANGAVRAEIDCVAVFDTVSAIGTPKSIGGQPAASPLVAKARDLHPGIRFGFQALALNEGRPDFTPEIWPGPNGAQTMKQTWFIGQHSDVGGGPKVGNANNQLQDAALRWMIALMHNSCQIGFAFENPALNSALKVGSTADIGQGQQNPGGFPTNIPKQSARTPGVASPFTEAIHISVRLDGLTNLAVKPALTPIIGTVSTAQPFTWTRGNVRMKEDAIIALTRLPNDPKDLTTRTTVHPIPTSLSSNPAAIPQLPPQATAGGIQGPIPT